MSIREIQEKIKVFLESDRLFYGIVFLLVAGLSFGVGRLSTSAVPRVASDSLAPPHIQKVDDGTSKQVAVPLQALESETSSSTELEVATQPATSGAYVGSKNSDKYHLPWCSGAKRIAEENKVWFANKEEAQKAGYTPAGNCPGI